METHSTNLRLANSSILIGSGPKLLNEDLSLAYSRIRYTASRNYEGPSRQMKKLQSHKCKNLYMKIKNVLLSAEYSE